MYAAVVTAFDAPPSYQPFPEPQPHTADQAIVDVVAVGLHPRVRSQASGSHYTSTADLPLVPGIDGVGRTSDGALRYFVLPDEAVGAMAERTVIDLRRSIVLPAGADPVRIAAAMNPAMSSWIALRQRIAFEPGQQVLILGATGSAGSMAVRIARSLGAGQVIAAGRAQGRLDALAGSGADATVSLNGDPADVDEALGRAAAEVDVVIDYLWGPPTAAAMRTVIVHRADANRPLAWIQVGSVAGPTAEIPSAALRAARLQIVGSGQGSVPTKDIVAELPALAHAIGDGAWGIETRTVPLSGVADAWADTGSAERIVVVPDQLPI